MIEGQKHTYCGRINWDNKKECSRCRNLPSNWLTDNNWESVSIENKAIEDLVPIVKEMIEAVGWTVGKEVTIEFIPAYNDFYVGDADEEEYVSIPAIDLNGFYIFPTKYEDEINTIGGKEKVTRDGWGLDTTVTEYNYPNEPDFEDQVEIGRYPSPLTAIYNALEYIFKQRLDNACESLAYRDVEKELPF